MLTTMLTGGYYIRKDLLPPFLQWLRFLSFSKYVYEVGAHSALRILLLCLLLGGLGGEKSTHSKQI
jgi:hypothetical protein